MIYLLDNSYFYLYTVRGSDRSLLGDGCLIYLLDNSYFYLYTVRGSDRFWEMDV
ncbi:hypothetical protein [Okeania sp. KiyG1]|uniref:hypothetical protein n=1 Tax=Okeania sp. KiyG1 TaxID=2720165 RepID=UPI001924424E|nr:hypothetical protein [Okeania sp. KiyG1]